ncbi:LysR family transcriptional regulator, partial [Pseudomonas syringae]
AAKGPGPVMCGTSRSRTGWCGTLSDADERMPQVIIAPMQDIDDAMEILNKFRDEPTGRIRLNILSDAAELLLGPVLPLFTERYPEIEIDLTVTNLIVDVIGGGHDAGVRYGGTVPEDMVAQRLSPDIRGVVGATPAYPHRFGVSGSPSE